MYDAIIVGARCAGAPTAMLLARKGYRVLLLDKARFPSDTLSVHYIHQPGVACLHRWGLLERVIASNCPPVRRQLVDFGPVVLEAAPPPIDLGWAGGSIADAYAPRRTILDTLLVEAAAAAGAEVRERFTVDDLLMDGEQVTGIRGHAARGTAVSETARIVIGADGLHSRVARRVGAPTYDVQPVFTCAYYAYWTDVPVQGAELYARPERMILAGPTNDGRTMVIVYWPVAAFHEVRSDIERHFLAALDLTPSLAERVRGGTRAERFRGTADLPNFYRRPHGPGWALVGDAGYHKDPITAQGITDAFHDAEVLAAAIDDGFASRRPLAEALAAYEQARNERTGPLYELTLQFATLQPPPPEMQQLIAALRHNPEQADRFIGTVAGTVPISEFFAPENLARITGSPVHSVAA
jgi:2-polyprenyl-6-methoxyphenol hydroxylase-like FAD-dependent oxidoreductase